MSSLGWILAAALALAPSSPESMQGRLRPLRDELAHATAELRAKLAKDPNAVVTTRDLSNCALALLESGGSVPEAEAWLRRALAAQNTRAGDPDEGALPWEINRDVVHDENAIEFGTAAWGPLLLLYGDRLTPAFRSELVAHARAALVALHRHTSDASSKKVEVSYTNIFLMNSVDLLLLGQALGDAGEQARADAQLEAWTRQTWQTGIHEYDSPTYYGADLDSLTVGFALARDPRAKARLRWALDLLWSDLCANYFPPRESLSGAHSRDYDFLSGRGMLDEYLRAEGLLLQDPPGKAGPEGIDVVLGEELPGAYRLSDSLRALASAPEKLVRSTFAAPGATPNDRVNYLTRDVSVSSVSADSGPQDKLVVWELPSGPFGPVISLIADTLDAPYGKEKIEGKDGHRKPRHVPLHPAVAQDRGAMLALLDLDAHHEKAISSLATNVVFPIERVAARIDGKAASLDVDQETPVALDAVLSLRLGSGCAAFRFFAQDGAGGQDPHLALVVDASGRRAGVARLASYAYRGPERELPERHVRVGLLALAGSCPGEPQAAAIESALRHARVDSQRENGAWTVRAELPGHPALEVSRDLDHLTVRWRRIGGAEVSSPGLLEVNGREIVAPPPP